MEANQNLPINEKKSEGIAPQFNFMKHVITVAGVILPFASVIKNSLVYWSYLGICFGLFLFVPSITYLLFLKHQLAHKRIEISSVDSQKLAICDNFLVGFSVLSVFFYQISASINVNHPLLLSFNETIETANIILKISLAVYTVILLVILERIEVNYLEKKVSI